ncbi:hypothetical protein [Huintestinicola sp.]|uniref:hypothetical protein n=1 Tax=Huintestinicola sp. TaxID=2981661 RepID=UPI003D7C8653
MTKRTKKAFLMLMTAALLLCGCTEKNKGQETAGTSLTSNGASLPSEETASETPPEPFSGYSFELRGAAENYLITLKPGEYADEIAVVVENNRYETRDFVITAPTGYAPSFPYDQSYASSAVKIIKNDIDDTYIPDIMQFTFDITQEELDKSGDNAVYSVSRMYTVDRDGELREINVVSFEDADGDGEAEEVVHDYIDRTQLYHSEPDKFIYEITVDDSDLYDENGDPRPIESRVKIKTLKFEYNVPRMVAGYEEITEDNTLYFGYACWAAANSAAQYFTMTTFNISDWENYVEMPRPEDSELSDYYFRIDDSRFSLVKDLKKYLRSIFTPKTAERIFAAAPQRYTDINGELYGIAGDGGYDFTLGTLTFSDVSVTKDRMVFRSRQEKFDETGNFTGYTDGGNFVIERCEDGLWRVSEYRYPYSLN